MEEQGRNGIIIVRKERGFTSFDVVAKLRGILKTKKIGHTGTLDPDAEGVLPVCIGKATRVCELLTDKDKEYEAVLLLGRTTDTQDITGTILSETTVQVSEADAQRAVLSFVGSYDQMPPMYSALKVNGKKLCDLARAGVEVERKPRAVTIHDITLLEISLPRIRMRVHCSKGTYIRTLCHDIGERLGCGGCMESLLRTRAAGFRLDQSHTLAELQKMRDEGRIDEAILPVDSVFWKLPALTANSSCEKLLYNGNKLPAAALRRDGGIGTSASGVQGQARVYDEAGNFVGIYEYIRAEQVLKPVKMFR